jgi:signal transduction histidine kinase
VMHALSLSRLRTLVDRSLAEVRLGAGIANIEQVSLFEFIAELTVNARISAEERGQCLTVGSVASDVVVDVDRQLLASAVSNLLQNAFKFTPPGGDVALLTHATQHRVSIEICDGCGGLPSGSAESLFHPFMQRSADHSGLGLGLSIALKAVQINSGDITVRDIPGKGCVFTIDLPRKEPERISAFLTKPTADPAALTGCGTENLDVPRKQKGHSRP